MTASQNKIEQLFEKGQKVFIGSLDRLPKFAQERFVKFLDYPYDYPELDGFTKSLMAIRQKQDYKGLSVGGIDVARQTFQKMQSNHGKPTFIKSVKNIHLPLNSGALPARHYHPNPNKKLPMIVFFHGGAFILGSLDTHDEVCRLIAKSANVQVISVDYPLTPEASPEKIIQSCEDALAWVYQNRRELKILKNRIAVAGDSAGGNISTVLAQRTVARPYTPEVQFLIYPGVDFSNRHPSYYAYKQGLVLTEDDIEFVTKTYVFDHGFEATDPLVSPTFGNLKKIAPAYIVTAGHDILHDEAEIYSKKLTQNGIKVEYVEYKDQTHGFINLSSVSRKAKKNLISMSKSFRKFWDKNS